MRWTSGEDAGGEGVRSAVGQLYGVLKVAGAKHGEHWAKNFLLTQRTGRVGVGKNMRSYKPASFGESANIHRNDLPRVLPSELNE